MNRILVSTVFVLVGGGIVAACGGTSDNTPAGGSGGATSGSGGATGSGGASSSGAATGSGGLVGVGGSNGTGAFPGSGGSRFQLPEGGLFGPAEKVVLDPTCPDTQYNMMGGGQGGPDGGTTLPGCCDKSNVCGVSTAPFAGGGFVSTQCLTPDEIQAALGRFGGLGGGTRGDAGFSFDGGADKPCTYKP